MPQKSIFTILCAALFSGLFAMPRHSEAQDFEYRGQLTSDLRIAVPGSDRPDNSPNFAFERSDNTLRFTSMLSWPYVYMKADLAFTFSGRSDVRYFSNLHNRKDVDPYYFESDALYVQLSDFVIDGLDFRLGRQVVEWGSADKFNPTNVINGDDIEDPLDFGKKIANEMLTVRYTPGWTVEGEDTPIFDEFALQLAFIPLFRSPMLPESGALAFDHPNEFRRFAHSKTLNRMIDIQELFLKYGGRIGYNVKIEEPDNKLSNAQFAAKLSWTLLSVDMSLMAYRGFDHYPQPKQAVINAVSTDETVNKLMPTVMSKMNGTDQEIDEIKSLLTSFGEEGRVKTISADTDVTLFYPKVWVLGADFSTSLDFLGGMGFWGEVAFTIHDKIKMNLDLSGNPYNDYHVDSRFFWKMTLGIDNTFTRWWYVNIQYLHGFANEFGRENIGDYIVAGTDLKAFNEQVLLRVFALVQLTEPSATIYPALSFKFWKNTEVLMGALVHLGKKDSTFGNRTVGRNFAFFQGKYTF